MGENCRQELSFDSEAGIHGPPSPNWSDIFKTLFVLIRSEIFKFLYDLVQVGPTFLRIFGTGLVQGLKRTAWSEINQFWSVNPCSEGPPDGVDDLYCCDNDLDNPIYDDLSEDDKELIRQKSKNLNVRASAHY